jgi:acyl-CoA reductase-like NAD-dependent aldehyde dehydrogenase
MAPAPAPAKTPECLTPEGMQRLRQAQAAWAGRPIRQRLHSIRRLRELLAEMQDEFCKAAGRDIFKPEMETLGHDLLPLAGACRYLEKRAARILSPRRIGWRDTPIWLLGQRDSVTRKPRGIVGIIGTWNYPFFLNGVQIVQALAAGNAVIWKPSEVTPACAAVLESWLRNAGFGPELAAVLPAERQWGPRLVEADVDHIVFTGHDQTGSRLAARLGERLISSTLELSGHDAVLVLEDADVDLAARALCFGTVVNAGQTCLAARRAHVARGLYADLLDRLRQEFSLRPADRPLAQPAQAAHVRELVDSALAGGARLLLDAPSQSKEFQPLVLADVKPDMAICQEALFAPVLTVAPFDDPREAMNSIRTSKYGLGLSIFTARVDRAVRMARELPAGLVTINDIIAPVAHPATPFGGVGRSGWGVTQGAEGLLEMTVPQVISTRRWRWRPHFDRPNSTPLTDPAVLRQMLRWQNGGSFWQRLRGFFAMIRAARGKH